MTVIYLLDESKSRVAPNGALSFSGRKSQIYSSFNGSKLESKVSEPETDRLLCMQVRAIKYPVHVLELLNSAYLPQQIRSD